MQRDTIISVEPCEQVYREQGLLSDAHPDDARRGSRDATTLYVCDFDNTVAVQDVGNEVLRQFAGTGWAHWAQLYREGRIGSRECLTRQYQSFRAGYDEYRAFVLTQELDSHFAPFVQRVLERGDQVMVVSDGIGNYIPLLFEKYGIPEIPVYCNQGAWNGSGVVELSFPFFQPACDVGCANCKFRHVRLHGAARKVYIGDGVSDQYAAQAADVIYAKDHLREFLLSRGIAHTPFANFGDVLTREELEA